MKILLEKAGKKYFNQWVFRHLDLELAAGESLAVLGSNGSGKSTLLQVLSGAHLLTEGKIAWHEKEKDADPEEVFRAVAIASPYLELVEEFTLEESVNLHFSFKNISKNVSPEEVIEISGLKSSRQKPVKFFSSGMKQRLKLTLACLSDISLLLLDEPCSNLDEEASKWYAGLIHQFGQGKTIVVCSNSHAEEYFFCQRKISLEDYKTIPLKQGLER